MQRTHYNANVCHHPMSRGPHLAGTVWLSAPQSGSSCSSRQVGCRHALWSRQPDDWDMRVQEEEDVRRQQRQQVGLVEQAVQDTVWRQQVDQVHQQLLDQQKHKAALRQRLQQDAQRAKREQLRRIEPVAKARARTNGLANLGWDPEILALSEKFGRLNRLVGEVQQRMEAQYGLISLDDAAALGLPPAAAAWAEAADHGRHPQMLQARVQEVGQQQGRMPQVQQQEQQQVTAWLRQGLQPGHVAAKTPAQLQQHTELGGMQANSAQQQLTPGPNMWQQLSRPDPQHQQHVEYPLSKSMANIQHPSQL